MVGCMAITPDGDFFFSNSIFTRPLSKFELVIRATTSTETETDTFQMKFNIISIELLWGNPSMKMNCYGGEKFP